MVQHTNGGLRGFPPYPKDNHSHANGQCGININKLKNIKLIENLYVQNVNVTNINGFENLKILNASGKYCGLLSQGIDDLKSSEKLDIHENIAITNITNITI